VAHSAEGRPYAVSGLSDHRPPGAFRTAPIERPGRTSLPAPLIPGSIPNMIAKMLIDGEWVKASGEATVPVVNPFDGKPVGEVPKGTREDVRKAIDAARDAFDKGPWPRLPPRARAEIYLKTAALLTERARTIAELESRNQGKTIKQAADADIPFSIDNLVFYAGACRTLDAKSPGEFTGDGTTIFRREPVGVVGSITPWNYPFMMAVWKIGPALVTGNTVVLKPASWTPLTTLELGRPSRTPAFPKGRSMWSPAPARRWGTSCAVIPRWTWSR
jgi:betaine-aldehyde dehydrogenase